MELVTVNESLQVSKDAVYATSKDKDGKIVGIIAESGTFVLLDKSVTIDLAGGAEENVTILEKRKPRANASMRGAGTTPNSERSQKQDPRYS